MKRVSLSATGLAVLVVMAMSALALSLPVNAQGTSPTGSGQALEIAPPVLSLSVNPGQTVTAKIILRDISNSPLIVTGQVNDFVAGDENGTPKILLNNSQPNPYSLRGWLSELPDLTLKPRQIQNLPVTIHVPATAAPGGYYGIIRFTATPPDLKQTGVSLSTSLGSLVLLTVNGAVKENLSIAEFSVSKGGKTGTVFQTTPLTFVERIQNNGNIHEEPTGQITITDMFGKKVANLNVNLEKRNVLPRSIRRFEAPLDSSVIGNKILFGRYTATLHLTYGSSKQTLNSQLTFWVIPYTLIGFGIIGLIAAFLLLRFMVRRYNRHIISRSQQPRRKK